MSWPLIIGLGIAAYAFRWAGLTSLRGRELRPVVDELLRLLPIALIGGLVFTETFADGGSSLTVDARVLGLGAAGAAVWLRLPLLGVFLAGVGTVAVARLAGVA